MRAICRSVLLLALFVPSAALAAEECTQWSLDGYLEIIQGKTTIVGFHLTQAGNGLQGTARYGSVTGDVSGSITGDEVSMTVRWSGGHTGVYTGTITPEYSYGHIEGGKVKGITVDQTDRKSRAAWLDHGPGMGSAECLTLANAAPAAPAPPPAPKTSGFKLKNRVLGKGAPAPQSPVSGWVGIWDTMTGDGTRYTLTLADNQGTGVAGSVGAADASLDGQITGVMEGSGSQLIITLTQPAVATVNRGRLQLTGTDSLAGSFHKETDPGTEISLTGTRRK